MFKSNHSNSRVKLMTKGLTVVAAALLLAMPIIGRTAAAAVAAVSSNFVFIVSSPQHLGDQPGLFPGTTFRGADQDFIFDAPGVNPFRRAVLVLEARAVQHPNVFQINGVTISGALQPRPEANDAQTFTEIADVPPGVLRANGNVLRVIARNINGQAGGALDDFVIDNVVLHYIEQ
jgi:hypothetical protein